jgi:ABC-type phosphate/phosphonate transport system substrate-binding protein
MPPWVMRSELPRALRQRLQAMLITLHEDATGRRILDACGVARFVALADSHDDPIRRMSAEAAGVQL